jgi:hypothetical protein
MKTDGIAEVSSQSCVFSLGEWYSLPMGAKILWHGSGGGCQFFLNICLKRLQRIIRHVRKRKLKDENRKTVLPNTEQV